jgi:hypothetical protein
MIVSSDKKWLEKAFPFWERFQATLFNDSWSSDKYEPMKEKSLCLVFFEGTRCTPQLLSDSSVAVPISITY